MDTQEIIRLGYDDSTRTSAVSQNMQEADNSDAGAYLLGAALLGGLLLLAFGGEEKPKPRQYVIKIEVDKEERQAEQQEERARYQRLSSRFSLMPVIVFMLLLGICAPYLSAAQNLAEADSLVAAAVRLCRQQEPQTAQALAFLNTALHLNPKHSANAYKWRSWAKQRTGDVQGAIEDISTAITMQPKEARFYAIRADLKQQQGGVQGAIDDIGLALQLAETSADTLVYQDIRAHYLTEKQRRDSLASRKK